jgi:hypothetical protein
VINHRSYALLPGTVSATEKRTVRLQPMPYDLAAAVLAYRGKPVNGALKAVECMPLSRGNYLEGEVIIVAADFALSHGNLRVKTSSRHRTAYLTRLPT